LYVKSFYFITTDEVALASDFSGLRIGEIVKNHLAHWLMGLVMLLVLAGSYTPAADGQVVVVVHKHHQHHRHYRHHHYHHYRH
jgi:hypothetical protein